MIHIYDCYIIAFNIYLISMIKSLSSMDSDFIFDLLVVNNNYRNPIFLFQQDHKNLHLQQHKKF